MLKRWMLFLVLTSFIPIAAAAQEGISQKQQERILAKKAKEDKKAQAKKEKADRQRHLSIQDKQTRKRMERNRRRADRGGPGPHRDGFIRRLFAR